MRIRKQKLKFYSLTDIMERNAQYNMIFGERSNGKTYAVLEYGLTKYVETGATLAIVRRYAEDFKSKRGATMFDGLVANGVIEKLTKGKWTGVHYWGGRWYFYKMDDNLQKKIISETPFAYAFSLVSTEHDKSTSYPTIETILFDEFLTRQRYLPDEFVLFMNTISTIVRYRDNVKIFMLGNTVNQYCPYFNEMGLSNIKKMRPGDIDLYEYGTSGLRVAVEYADNPNRGKPSDLYFAFNNPKLQMITGGTWELALYPHCPCKYKPNEVIFTYFIEFNGDLLQCEIVSHETMLFTFIHRKTGAIKYPETDIVYSPEFNPRPNYRRKITGNIDILDKKVYYFFKSDKVFYQDNEVGEVVRNYLSWCSTESILNR